MGDDLIVDVRGYFAALTLNITNYDNFVSTYNTDRYKIQGIKIVLDGSIQLFTAALT